MAVNYKKKYPEGSVRYFYFGILACLLLIGSAYFLNLFASDNKNPLRGSDSIREAMIIQNAMRQIYQEVNTAVVRIEIEDTFEHPFANDPLFRRFFNIPEGGRQGKRRGFVGSGFVINKNGLIITNHHVISKRNSKAHVDKVRVRFTDGRVVDAKIIGSDQASDIALLKVKTGKSIKAVHIGNSADVEVGDFAIAIGNPFGLSSTFTMGVISSRGQDINATDGIPRLQTDAPINPGNSGGPLLNIRGEVIGINQMIYTRSGGSLGIGFAIPIDYAMNIIQKLKKGEAIQHGYIGVSVIPEPTEEQVKELSLKGREGLLVAQVALGSPAWKGGIRPYDFIIKIDGSPATKFSDLKSAVVTKGVGKSIRLIVLRNGKERTFNVKIGEAKRR